MKKCSKCKLEQPEENFVKASAYKDGLYPSCKSCRKKSRLESLGKNRMCSLCGLNPHTSNHSYCYSCQRSVKGQDPEPSYRRDSTNKTMCCRCKVKPRHMNLGYCLECQSDYNREWMRGKGGQWKYLCDRGQRDKALARHYVSQNVRRGKLERKPCKICGEVIVQGHHHLGYERDHYADVVWLCVRHHQDATNNLISFDKNGELVDKVLKT